MNTSLKQKLTSRKLWAALVGVVVGLAAAAVEDTVFEFLC